MQSIKIQCKYRIIETNRKETIENRFNWNSLFWHIAMNHWNIIETSKENDWKLIIWNCGSWENSSLKQEMKLWKLMIQNNWFWDSASDLESAGMSLFVSFFCQLMKKKLGNNFESLLSPPTDSIVQITTDDESCLTCRGEERSSGEV